ncbi:response regulator transcription factor [Ekhidna sp. To15]|uniref:response regulator transcription factor n=1 Tax=Ekhidna sp. To15 TaxID=3395267 RepID=UPI003F51D81A
MKRLQKLNRIYWIYGGVMGLLMIVLQIIHYKTLVRDMEVEVYGGIVGILFLFFGIWLGTNTFRKKSLDKYDREKLGLSKRELEVLELLSQGLSNQEVADKLFVSLNTAKTHISSIYTKLNVKRRTQAIQKARDLALIHPPKE